jgi:dipeptidyl aminopeptidase/acylaminoacyl peptidase
VNDLNGKRTFDPLDELRYKRIASARISPNGKWVVYDLTENNIDTEETFTSLWRVDLETGETRRLTHGNHKNSTPEWSPDGMQIAFLSNRDGKQQVYLLSSEGGEARKLTDMKQGVGRGPVWSPDGQSIAFTSGPVVEPRDPKKPYRVTRFVYRFDGIGNLDDAVQNIYVQPVSGGEPVQLTHDAQLNHTIRWSPDGKEILYLAAHDPEKPNLFSSKVRVVNLEGVVEELVELDFGLIVNANWSPDGKRVLFAGATGEFPMGSKFDLWIMDRHGGTPENRTKDLKWGVNYEWISSRNEKILSESFAWVNVPIDGSTEIYSVTLSGEPKFQPLIGGQRTLSLRDANEQHLLYVTNTLENPTELCIANLDGYGEQQITHVNDALVAQIAFPKVEHVTFKSEGVDVAGWILLPVSGKPPYPTILYIHGGPHGWYGFQWGSDFQMLAGAGYAVLFTNPRGSKGYGDEFSTALSGNWGVMDYKDLMAGVDYAVEKGIADPDLLGVCGLSYGGFMTCFTVGQTRRFKAAVAENPITDLVSRYGTADMGPWGSISELGGKPHEIPDVYRRSSPITYAHTCTTPTLLIQGEADYRCPIGQSEQFYAHLKANGCITEMVRYPEMSHLGAISGPVEVQKSQNDELLGWMNKYVLGK